MPFLLQGFLDFHQLLQQVLGQVETQHVSTIGFGFGWVRMGFHEDTVGTCRNARFGDKANEFGLPSCDAATLVGLLQGMGDV